VNTTSRPLHLFASELRVKAAFVYAFSCITTILDRPPVPFSENLYLSFFPPSQHFQPPTAPAIAGPPPAPYSIPQPAPVQLPMPAPLAKPGMSGVPALVDPVAPQAYSKSPGAELGKPADQPKQPTQLDPVMPVSFVGLQGLEGSMGSTTAGHTATKAPIKTTQKPAHIPAGVEESKGKHQVDSVSNIVQVSLWMIARWKT
jgi:hypothetical protein